MLGAIIVTMDLASKALGSSARTVPLEHPNGFRYRVRSLCGYGGTSIIGGNGHRDNSAGLRIDLVLHFRLLRIIMIDGRGDRGDIVIIEYLEVIEPALRGKFRTAVKGIPVYNFICGIIITTERDLVDSAIERDLGITGMAVPKRASGWCVLCSAGS